MKQSVAAVLARYEERSKREFATVAAMTMQEYLDQRDGFLLDIGIESARFLNLLIKAVRPRLIVEVGTSYGYSTVWLAEAAEAAGARVMSFEVSPSKLAYARQQIEEAGLASVVEFVEVDALAGIQAIAQPVDFALIDLWKELYIPALDALYPRLAQGAIVAADNICLPAIHAPVMQGYVRHVRSLAGMQSVTVPVGSGLELSRYSLA